MSDERITSLETRVGWLERRILESLTNIQDLVAAVQKQAVVLEAQHQRFQAHVEAEEQDRKEFLTALAKLTASVEPVIDERRALATVAKTVRGSAALVAAAVSLAAWGPQALAWVMKLLH